jgi:hypothetical protein
MIEYHDPKAEVNVENFPYDLNITITGSNQATVGLLANGFPDSENFLNHIADVLLEREPGVKLERYNKGNASIPASAEILDSIGQNCQAVIAAYGH